MPGQKSLYYRWYGGSQISERHGHEGAFARRAGAEDLSLAGRAEDSQQYAIDARMPRRWRAACVDAIAAKDALDGGGGSNMPSSCNTTNHAYPSCDQFELWGIAGIWQPQIRRPAETAWAERADRRGHHHWHAAAALISSARAFAAVTAHRWPRGGSRFPREPRLPGEWSSRPENRPAALSWPGCVPVASCMAAAPFTVCAASFQSGGSR